MGLLDYYKQFESMSDEEVSAELRARAEERRRRALARIEALDLSKTTWHEFPHPDVVAAVTYAVRRGINRAPESDAHELRHELAMRLGVEPDRVVAGNGAAGLLRTAAALLLGEGDELVTPWPSYPLYPLMARDAGARAVPVPGFDPAALASAVNRHTRVLVLCNPNDPTGQHLGAGELDELLRELPEQVTVLLDEALVDFVDDEPGGGTLALLDDHPRLVLFRTFSKVYGLAGLRVGYAVGGEGSEQLVARLAPPLGLADPQQAGALEALHACAGQVARRREQVVDERRRLLDELAGLPVDVTPGQANVLWMRAPGLTGLELTDRLRRSGILVAPGAAVGADEHVRATIQSRPASDRLVQALRTALDESDETTDRI
jgi:histidinol-phosphate aminotransferase